MRFCIPIPCFYGRIDFCEAIRRVRSLGFDCAETYNWKSLDLDQVREVCRENGVELRSMCTTEFRMTDPAFRKEWLSGLKESALAAKKVGAGFLISQVGPDTGAERAFQHEAIAETLRQSKGILEETGITLMLEPLNTLVNHPGYYLVHAAEAFELIREVDHPQIKIVYDMYHQQVSEGNLLPTMLNNLDQIAHLHAAGHPGRHELQLGETNYPYVFRKLDEAGYQGACGLEYNPLMDPDDSLKEFRRLFL